MVLGIVKKDIYKKNTMLETRVELITKKNNFTGPGNTKIWFTTESQNLVTDWLYR